MGEKYLVFNLEDEKSKKLGEVLGNQTCRKIINLLAEKELSASEISRELHLAINTITYNIDNLIEAGLIEEAKSWWSVKGRKMPSYKVVNKSIVISPRKTSNIYSKLKGVLPVVLISAVFTGFFFWFEETRENASHSFTGIPQLTEKAAAAADLIVNSASASLDLWVLGAIWLVVLAFVVYSFIKKD